MFEAFLGALYPLQHNYFSSVLALYEFQPRDSEALIFPWHSLPNGKVECLHEEVLQGGVIICSFLTLYL